MIDILLDNDFEVQTANGDILCATSDKQHQGLLLMSHPGEWKENPAIGVGIAAWLNDENPGNLKGEIVRQYKADGMQVNAVDFTNGKLQVDAAYG